jgi:hypothetical protein
MHKIKLQVDTKLVTEFIKRVLRAFNNTSTSWSILCSMYKVDEKSTLQEDHGWLAVCLSDVKLWS